MWPSLWLLDERPLARRLALGDLKPKPGLGHDEGVTDAGRKLGKDCLAHLGWQVHLEPLEDVDAVEGAGKQMVSSLSRQSA